MSGGVVETRARGERCEYSGLSVGQLAEPSARVRRPGDEGGHLDVLDVMAGLGGE